MIGTLTICPSDLRTLAIEDGLARLAVAEDTTVLDAATLTALKALRATLRKAKA